MQGNVKVIGQSIFIQVFLYLVGAKPKNKQHDKANLGKSEYSIIV